MEPIKFKRNVERGIQDKIIVYLRQREWVVKEMHGNAYQSGVPDLMAGHSKYGARLIEVKQATQFSFTKAQLEDFPKMVANGLPIWIMTDASDEEYAKLFKGNNFHEYYMAALSGSHDITKWRRGA